MTAAADSCHLLYQEAFKPALKQMTGFFIADIISAGIGGTKSLHAFGKVAAIGLQQNLVMVGHQDISIHLKSNGVTS